MLLALIAPLLAVFWRGLAESAAGVGIWQELLDLLGRQSVRASIRFSLGQAAVSAALSVLIALPGGYLLSHISFPGRRAIQGITLLPFVLPSLVIVLAVISMYGRSGLLNTLLGSSASTIYSPFGIILAHVLFNISVALRMLADGWQAVDEQLCEASSSLGESFFRRLWRLDIPLLMPAILSSFTVIFLYCLMSFGIVLVFGGLQYSTMEVRIYQEMFQQLNLPGASLLAFLQLAIAGCCVLLLQFGIPHRVRRKGGRLQLRSWRSRRRLTRWLTAFYWAAVGMIFFSPLATLIIRAFRPGGELSLAAFAALLGDGRLGRRNLFAIIQSTLPEVLATSIGIALLSSLLAVSSAWLLARIVRGQRIPWLDSLLMLPLAISGVTLSLGLRLLLDGILPPLLVIALSQAIMSFPLAFRILRTSMDNYRSNYIEAAQSVGAGRFFRLWSLDVPLLAQGLTHAFAMALALGLANFSAVMTIGQGRIVTVPVAIYRLIGFQSFDAALALAVLYMGALLLVFLLAERTAVGRETDREGIT